MIPAEQWRPVPCYESSYQVSDRGQVRTRHGRLLKPFGWGSTHHLYVALYRGNRRHYQSVARLVLAAFDRPPRPGEQARHFPDHDPANNWIGNLRWGTFQENMDDKRYHGTLGQAKLTEADVVAIRQAAAIGTPAKQLAQEHGVTTATIRSAVQRKTWRHV